MNLVELPQGVVIEVRRGGHDALAKLAGDMSRLGISGYIRIERRPKGLIPRVSQVIIHENQPKIAIHDADITLGGLEALLEIERDSTALDALISLVELTVEDVLRVINLYPDFSLSLSDDDSEKISPDWWNYVQLNTRSWRREARLPEPEVVVEPPEYIRQLTKAKLQKFELGETFLKYGDILLNEGTRSSRVFDLAGILASHGRPIMVLSREKSRTLANSHDIPESSSYMLSHGDESNAIPPSPYEINDVIAKFLWANKQAIIVLSDIEYILAVNDYSSFMKMLRSIIDEVRSSDHLLIVHCNLDVFDARQRHAFSREFDTITDSYIENLIGDAESLLDHPICMELSDEELSWIQQQINFSTSESNAPITENQEITGGASNIISEDLEEAKENLNKLVDDWQNTNLIADSDNGSDTVIQDETKVIDDLVGKVFTPISDVEVVNQSNQEHIDEVKPESLVGKENNIQNHVKRDTPRVARKVKRPRRRSRQEFNTANSLVTIAAASKNVELPDLVEVTKLEARNQAYDRDMEGRSQKIDNALDKMLTSPERQKSRQTYLDFKQNTRFDNASFPRKVKQKAFMTHSKITSETVVHSGTNIVDGGDSKRRIRESASRSQNTVDVDKNYQKWSTEYGKGPKVSESELEEHFSGGGD